MNKEKAVIFDLDNTILYQTNRSPLNWSDLSGDKLIPAMDMLLESLYLDYKIFLVTGRPESCRENTEKWLFDNDIPYTNLFLKQDNPMSKAVVHKEKVLLELLEKYDIILAFEDDTKCCEMYVRNNIITLCPLNYKIK